MPDTNIRRRRRDASSPSIPAWDEQLREFVDTSSDSPRPTPPGKPLAVELALSRTDGDGSSQANSGSAEYRLEARPMRRGKKGKWIYGSMVWGGLSWQSSGTGDARRDHVALLEDLSSVLLSSIPQKTYYNYGHYDEVERSVDLSRVDGVRLWSILTAAPTRDIVFLHADQRLGEMPVRTGEILVDITADGDSEGVTLLPVLHVDGVRADELQILMFAGTEGQGVVCAVRDDIDRNSEPFTWHLQLVHLHTPASEPLRRMVAADFQVRIPADDVQRFIDEKLPALAGVVGGDGEHAPAALGARPGGGVARSGGDARRWR
jgi:hypothetical protein